MPICLGSIISECKPFSLIYNFGLIICQVFGTGPVAGTAGCIQSSDNKLEGTPLKKVAPKIDFYEGRFGFLRTQGFQKYTYVTSLKIQ